MPGRIQGFISESTMGFKLTAAFILVILIPMTLLAYLSYKVTDALLMDRAGEKLEIGIKAAWSEYYIRADQMRYGMLQAASSDDIKRAVSRRDRAYLEKVMSAWSQKRQYVDVWTVVDGAGRVIARLGSDYRGDAFEPAAIVKAAIKDREPKVSTLVFPANLLKKEAGRLIERYEATKDGTWVNVGSEIDGSTGGLAITVVTPVLDDAQRPIGAIITADVLNRENHIAEAVAAKIPGLFTTISLGGRRISTNLASWDGRPVVSTELPGQIRASLSRGKAFVGEWKIQDAAFVSMFEPIRDFDGAIIGSIDVGMNKESLWLIQKRNQQIILLMALIGLTLSVLAAVASTRMITGPLKRLMESIDAFASGAVNTRAQVDSGGTTRDEIKLLARTYNAMMDDVNRRSEEKERYLRDLEDKNREAAELNLKLKSKNEEIEVAYEETQSQTEELHAVNEELKLLNEDLDRKNDELKKANETIIMEESELRKSKDKIRLVYDSISDYLLVIDYDHRIVEANSAFLEDLHMDEQRALGARICGFFKLESPHPDCPVRRSIEMRRPQDLEYMLPDGRVLLWRSYPLIDEDSLNKKAVVHIKDVTEQRLLTQKLIHSDKLSSLGELVSGVAHELNNPLTGIMCFSEILMDEQTDEGARLKLRKINDASMRCKKIIENLLTFARWQKPEKVYCDVNKVIKEAIDLRAYQLKVDNIEIKTSLDEAVPFTMLDPHQLQQVFLNLINNARDAILEKTHEGVIAVTSSFSAGKITVKVEDSGKGISDEIAAKLFDPFFTTKEVGQGTGLGLSISYGIIKEHGGDIRAGNRPEGGAVFTVDLPLMKKEAKIDSYGNGKAALLDEYRARAAGKKALVLDDEAIVLDVLSEALAATGFEVESADNAADALSKLTEKDYDVIISDMKMPGLSGRDFYDEVKKVKPQAISRIIFVTGDNVNKDTRTFLEATGNLTIRKPFTLEKLGETVMRVIS